MYSAVARRAGGIACVMKRVHGSGQVMSHATSANPTQYETLKVSVPQPFVYHVELNRAQKLNSFSNAMWIDISSCFERLSDDADCRVIVLSGAGRLFTAGLDLTGVSDLATALAEQEDVARKCKILAAKIKLYQDSITSLEKCAKPVICAVHNACVGAGVDLITAGDIRICTEDAWFQVKEVAIGMAADVGTLQRLPRVIGSDSLVRDLAYTARKMQAAEAKECGLVSRVYDNKDNMMTGAMELAADIAAKSPVAVQGTKRNLNYSKNHSVQEGLDHIRDYNMTMLQSEDFINAAMAQAIKSDTPTFSKL